MDLKDFLNLKLWIVAGLSAFTLWGILVIMIIALQ